MACFFFGTSNFLTGHLSSKLGTAGGYPFFIGNLLSWLIYHLVIGWQNRQITDSFWNRETSTYFDVHTKKLKGSFLMGPLLRGIVQVAVFFSVFLTMRYAFLAQVNQGIIASLFSTSIIISAIVHLIGLTFMILAVALISVEQAYYLTVSILLAILCGVILTINGVIMRHYVKYMHISALQLNNDGGLIQMIVLMILFILHVRDNGMYETADLLESVGASLLSMCANVTLSQAFAVGLGGPVQGINNLMSLVQTAMAAIFLSQIPSMLQNFGLSSGLIGAFIMCGVDKIIWSKD